LTVSCPRRCGRDLVAAGARRCLAHGTVFRAPRSTASTSGRRRRCPRERGLRRAVRGGACMTSPATAGDNRRKNVAMDQHPRARHHPGRDPDLGAHSDHLGHPD
jgi:hypothetical protein